MIQAERAAGRAVALVRGDARQRPRAQGLRVGRLGQPVPAAPGSYCDVTYPGARVGDRLFRGSGTSQASAVVTGAVAGGHYWSSSTWSAKRWT
ncbi:hypothetical protein [Dactylosporangium sp. NPDC048998]|uniref:hypothetical protein n=1 Tax=Dactylosporangium sp. NPDC048998 TaxID=3363976 RepID=UPI00371480A6